VSGSQGTLGRAGVRIQQLVQDLIETFELDLRGLTVLTEAASGPYLWTPLIAARAGATRVLALTRDSGFDAKESVRDQTLAAAEAWGVAAQVEVSFERRPDWVEAADVVTNSGFVRPIDAGMVSNMKATAVVPLMWETWEARESDVDLAACREKGILVLGTRESEPPCDMKGYAAPLAIKMLLELGLEVHRTRIALLGAQPILGAPMCVGLRSLGVDVTWFGSDEDAQAAAFPYAGFGDYIVREGRFVDAIVVAEHRDPQRLLGSGGLADWEELRQMNPSVALGIIAGNVDCAGLAQSGLHYFPADIRPFGYMSYQASALGPRPVLELYTAGLKVGLEMARARLAGLDVAAARARALQRSPAMSFDDG
jgi:hypothetical protein